MPLSGCRCHALHSPLCCGCSWRYYPRVCLRPPQRLPAPHNTGAVSPCGPHSATAKAVNLVSTVRHATGVADTQPSWPSLGVRGTRGDIASPMFWVPRSQRSRLCSPGAPPRHRARGDAPPAPPSIWGNASLPRAPTIPGSTPVHGRGPPAGRPASRRHAADTPPAMHARPCASAQIVLGYGATADVACKSRSRWSRRGAPRRPSWPAGRLALRRQVEQKLAPTHSADVAARIGPGFRTGKHPLPTAPITSATPTHPCPPFSHITSRTSPAHHPPPSPSHHHGVCGHVSGAAARGPRARHLPPPAGHCGRARGDDG